MGRDWYYPTAAALVRTETLEGGLCELLHVLGPHSMEHGAVRLKRTDHGMTTAYHWLAGGTNNFES